MNLRGGGGNKAIASTSAEHVTAHISVKVLLRFRMNYKTQYGENLVLLGSLSEFGNLEEPTASEVLAAAAAGKGARMRYINNDDWGLDIVLEMEPEAQPPPSVWYRYVVVDDLRRVRPIVEGGAVRGRALHLAGPALTYPSVMEVRDVWRDPASPRAVLLRSGFVDVAFHDPARAAAPPALPPAAGGKGDEVSVRLTVVNPRVERGHVLGVIGSCAALGGWEDGKVALMTGRHFPLWELEMTVPRSQLPFEYRYVIVDPAHRTGGGVLAVEQGERARRLSADPAGLEEGVAELRLEPSARASRRPALVQNDDLSDTYPLYKTEWRGAGVAVPVFGLRSDAGMGVGEFLDLRPTVDICAKAKLKVVQLLPVTDTTSWHDERDSYPYSSISVHALHPIYIRIGAIPGLPAPIRAEAEAETKRLNDPGYFKKAVWDEDLKTELVRPVDYTAVIAAKDRLLRRAYDEIGAGVLASAEFQAFFAETESWLRPYGLFCWLRDFFGTANHEDWGALGTGRVSKEKLLKLTGPSSELYRGVAYSWVVQYWAHLQLKEASDYAVKQGVMLKGDLPIGVDHDSVDAWYEPHLFHMDKKTGAPPDDYAENGQNWGFPTYNWEVMAQDNFSWWRARLHSMARYFHAFRIDHILGFFRIWEMPAAATTGLLGRFRPSLPLTRDELNREGLGHDVPRLCSPYIRPHIMQRLFGGEWFKVKDRFLDDMGGGILRFKDGLWSEVALKAIVDKEGSCLPYQAPKDLLTGLSVLCNNVVLLRDDKDPEGKFYPRIEMWKTSSFQELSGDMQHRLRGLYQSYFYGRQDQFWADLAMQKLPALMDASEMVVCGEDLGMIPACVAGVLDKLVIMGLKIQRMPAPGQGKFGRCNTYPHLSVCTPSCHDMSTVAGWWEENKQLRQELWNTILQRPGEAPARCNADIASMIVKQHLWSPSMLAIFPIQDLMAMDDRLANPNPRSDQINWPPNPKHYWRWRCHITLEELEKKADFISNIRNIVEQSGRDGGY